MAAIANICTGVGSVIFAIISGFVIVALWQDISTLNSAIGEEVNALADLSHTAQAAEHGVGRELLDAIRDYVNIVVTKEWPAMKSGDPVGNSGSEKLEQLYRLLRVQTDVPVSFDAERSRLHGTLDILAHSRRIRLGGYADHIPAVIWGALYGNVVALIVMLRISTSGNRKVKFMSGFNVGRIALFGLTVSLLLFPIVVMQILDHPFSANLKIDESTFRGMID
ncbi:hypothetical protein ACN6AT_35360 (plasmid) [Streptomyces sp. JL4002]|uniref:bestrophin-like domain n=1 Tax=Streptomyces sp. JL4002 TaxID=3404781 RepID=UPI003B289D34